MIMSCKWNYKPNHCSNSTNCPYIPKLLHGNLGEFHRYNYSIFATIYNAIDRFQLQSQSICTHLIDSIHRHIQLLPSNARCYYNRHRIIHDVLQICTK